MLTIVISCSQKYDETGIFDPSDDLNFTAVTCDSITIERIRSFSASLFSDRYAFIGGDINGTDTVSYARIALRTGLPALEDLDSSFIVYKIDKKLVDSLIDPTVYNIEVLKLSSDLPDTIDHDPNIPATLFTTASIKDNTADNSYELKFSMSRDSIEAWTTADTLKTTASFIIKSTAGSDPFPVIKFYSTGWGFPSVRPLLISYYSYTNDEDSLITETLETPLSKDFTLAYKAPAPAASEGSYVLGGISGEKYLCRIDLSEIPANAIILNADLIFEKTGIDSVYGGISRTDKPYLLCWSLQDSTWQDGGLLSTDSLLVNENTTYGLFINIDNFVHSWINEPENYYGFMIDSKNWDNPLGWTSYKKPVIMVKYIIPE
jgi:hypothetical protein